MTINIEFPLGVGVFTQCAKHVPQEGLLDGSEFRRTDFNVAGVQLTLGFADSRYADAERLGFLVERTASTDSIGVSIFHAVVVGSTRENL
ncbi:hypothetical protein PQR02_04740 [Paraburkholderia sediminicola]|uniref:Uncharacterized protein n=1 Tax=Paraburkholderia rhynchosiae TaxID=487049 RepID=A0ACC7N9A4_9BURK